jgi:hypothetical protein
MFLGREKELDGKNGMGINNRTVNMKRIESLERDNKMRNM